MLQSTSQSQICTKKCSWSFFVGLLHIRSTVAFWILVKPLHLRSMLSKLMRCTQYYNAFGQHWSTERSQLCSTMMPGCTLCNQCFKSWTNWAMKLCLIHYTHLTSCQLITTSSSTSTIFRRDNASKPTGGWKDFRRAHWILKHGFLCYRNKQS